MMWEYGSGFGGWAGGLGFGLHGVGMLLFWGLLVLGIVLLVRAGARRAPAVERREDVALAVLKERYARGELTREQFRSMREALR